MKQAKYGFLIYLFLMIPLIAIKLEEIMLTHMLVQLPLLIVAGSLMARYFQIKFPRFFKKWNRNGIPGIILFIIITTYWMIPRVMDETLMLNSVEIFKYVSLPFLAGIPLRDSWEKLGVTGKTFVMINYISMFGLMGWFYIDSPIQICNNYLKIEQQQLGWGFLIITATMIIYILQAVFIDQSRN